MIGGMLGNVEKLQSQIEVDTFVSSTKGIGFLLKTMDKDKLHRKAQE